MNRKFLNGLFYALLPLLLSACTRQFDPPADKTEKEMTSKLHTRELQYDELVTTVAAIKKLANGDVEFHFNERQTIFTVVRTNPVYNRVLSTATEGLRTTKPVKLISTGGRTFTDLVWPTAAETNRYLDWYRMKLADPEASRVLNQNELDSLYFNDASWQNWKTFRLCIKTIPSFVMAKTIFDYCAAQGCYLGTAQVQPCIPFEYVPDGCFVRAHKMKEIIEKKFSYCCEKVFSYGELNIRADKWGGCCISWWYHVAPMIRVKEGGRTVCYVIDPSMFNEPVLLSTWLDAQQNTSCNPNARVNRYSIQPSSAYTPEYTTDPNYADTNFNLPYFDFLGNSCPN